MAYSTFRVIWEIDSDAATPGAAAALAEEYQRRINSRVFTVVDETGGGLTKLILMNGKNRRLT